MTDRYDECNMNVSKNVNLSWIAATGLAVWFLFWHAPVFWKNRHILQTPRDVVLAVHIVAAGIVYLACAHNCLVTPSVHPLAKVSHTWIGRLGLLTGIIGFSLGTYLTWSRLTMGGGAEAVEGSTTLGFSIPITIGGILQIICELRGFRAIRHYKSLRTMIEQLQLTGRSTCDYGDELRKLREAQDGALRSHIDNMLSLFVMACGIPAGIRLAGVLSFGDEGVIGILAIGGVVYGLYTLRGRYINKMMPPAVNEIEVAPIGPASYGGI